MKVCCSICKEHLKPECEVTAVNCGHLFHDYCIRRWCEKSKTCPHCRAVLNEDLVKIKFEIQESVNTLLPKSEVEEYLRDYNARKSELTELMNRHNCLEARLLDLQVEALHNEMKAKKMKFDATVWKQEFLNLEKSGEMAENLQEENRVMRETVDMLTKLNKLITGTDCDMYNVLVGLPINSRTVEELCTFIQVLKSKLKSSQRHYEEKKAELLLRTDTAAKQYHKLLEANIDVDLDKSVQS